MRATRAFFAPILFFCASLTAQQAAAPPAVRSRDGEACAPGRWYTDGGNAARNAATTNPPLLRRPLVAWRKTVGGTVLGEPLVWDQHVVLALWINDKRRSIEVRRLGDGNLVGQRTLDSTSDPAPALWGNEIVWRVGAGGLELLRIGKKGVEFATRMPNAKAVGPALRLGTRVYAVVDGHVTCMRAGDFRSLWRSPVGGCHGPLSLVDQTLYAVRSAADGRHVVVALDRQTGAERAASASFLLTRPPAEDLRLQLAGTTLLARLGSGSLLAEFRAPGIELNALRWRLPLAANAEGSAQGMPLAHALDGRWQVGVVPVPRGKQLGLFAADRDEGIRLDTCDVHRALADVPPTIAGNVMYFGACAVDLTDYRMLWRLQRDGDHPLPTTRAIPAGRTLLLAHGQELVALREDAPAEPVAAELQTAWRDDLRSRTAPLVDDALAAADWELAGDLLARCRELEIDEAWASKREKDLTAKAKDQKAKADAAKAERTRAAAEAAAGAALDQLHRSLAAWTTRPPLDHRQALRFLLARSAGHPGAVADVRALLPKDLQPPEPFLATDWLDFLDATATTKVTFLDARLAEFADDKLDPVVAQSKQQLLEWRAKWRQDLQALQSDRLLLFSPISSPGSLAKSLATGELVCDLLEGMFAGMPKVRSDPRPMLVFIYPDQKEYLAESKKIGVEDVEWTAGYYSDSLNELVAKSRLFVPADDTGFATVLPTLAHELTHQWLMDRCQAFTPDPVASRVGAKAFWIVEGFASLVEQFDFDFARRQTRLGTGNLERADLVASAKDKQLLDWDWLTGCKRIDYARLSASQREIDVPSSVHLGQRFKTRGISLFYAQAAMLTRYLYDTEDGRHRGKLLEFVAAYYTGKTDQLDFAKAFGVTAKELGPKVVEYSRALVR